MKTTQAILNEIQQKVGQRIGRDEEEATWLCEVEDMLKRLQDADLLAEQAKAEPVAISAEDRFEQFVQASIDQAPEPLRRLGEYLTRVLDDDHFETANRMLLGIAATKQPTPVVAPQGGDVRKDAENWGSALNDASWEFLENCPEKSTLLFNNCKPALRLAIFKYLDKALRATPADGETSQN